ncbi:hypothetical protein SAMN05444412_106189 [Rhodonellum ikkaensis]|uniref:Uncharacterized protein n=1 Tax=Rhodonellum ikkaensis TaxID=336829 RepID=A0A1H3QM58_9BACT|nr:hypothetical protein SAMN05444412_106189 [Rhodonellum ikkaensis]
MSDKIFPASIIQNTVEVYDSRISVKSKFIYNASLRQPHLLTLQFSNLLTNSTDQPITKLTRPWNLSNK